MLSFVRPLAKSSYGVRGGMLHTKTSEDMESVTLPFRSAHLCLRCLVRASRSDLAILVVRDLTVFGSTNLRAGGAVERAGSSRDCRIEALEGLAADEEALDEALGAAFVEGGALGLACLFSSSIARRISSTFGSRYFGVTGLLAACCTTRAGGGFMSATFVLVCA